MLVANLTIFPLVITMIIFPLVVIIRLLIIISSPILDKKHRY